MKKIWYSFLLLILGLSVISPLNINYETTAMIFVLLHSIVVILILMTYEKYRYSIILIYSFLIRVFFMFWDVYARSIFILPSAGVDDDGFYQSATLISSNLSLLKGDIYGGLYSKITGLIFYLTGPSKILGGYINVILGISVVILLFKTMRLLNVEEKKVYWMTVLVSFFPNAIFLSAMFRREMIMTFLIALSLYVFIKWFIEDNRLGVFVAIFLVLFASIFHSGVIGVISGYIFAYVFYKRKAEKISFSNSSVITFVIILLFLLVLYILLGEQFLAKFGESTDVSDIIYASNLGEGGARYLGGLNITNLRELLAYSPIKMIYFLLSPMPWDWRGIADVLTFLFDSTFYLFTIIFFMKNKKKFNISNNIIKVLLISILVTSLIFGIGVGNAGTALRHRVKLLPLFALFLATMMSDKTKYNNEKLGSS